MTEIEMDKLVLKSPPYIVALPPEDLKVLKEHWFIYHQAWEQLCRANEQFAEAGNRYNTVVKDVTKRYMPKNVKERNEDTSSGVSHLYHYVGILSEDKKYIAYTLCKISGQFKKWELEDKIDGLQREIQQNQLTTPL